MKRILAAVLFLLLLSCAAALADTLETPKLVSAPETVTFYDRITVEVEPVPNAEKYKLHIQDPHNSIYEDYEFDEPVIVYDDWPAWSGDTLLTLSITAEAEGYEPGEPLVLECEVKNCDDSIRPDPPEVTITYSDEIVTNKSRMTFTISEDYDAFTITQGSATCFPIEQNTYETNVNDYCQGGEATVTVRGRKNGIWSLPGKEITISCIEAEYLAVPEFRILSDPIYLNEPVEIEILTMDERAEDYRVSIRRPSDRIRNIKGLSLASVSTEESHFFITEWNELDEPFEPGEYTVRIKNYAEKYNASEYTVTVTVLAERPDEEKVTMEQLQENGAENSNPD